MKARIFCTVTAFVLAVSNYSAGMFSAINHQPKVPARLIKG